VVILIVSTLFSDRLTGIPGRGGTLLQMLVAFGFPQDRR